MTSGSNVTRDVHWCVTVDYQQTANDDIANQIHGFTVDYGKFILNTFIVWLRKLLRCDWLRTRQFIGNSQFAQQCKLTHAFAIFSVIINISSSFFASTSMFPRRIFKYHWMGDSEFPCASGSTLWWAFSSPLRRGAHELWSFFLTVLATLHLSWQDLGPKFLPQLPVNFTTKLRMCQAISKSAFQMANVPKFSLRTFKRRSLLYHVQFTRAPSCSKWATT